MRQRAYLPDKAPAGTDGYTNNENNRTAENYDVRGAEKSGRIKNKHGENQSNSRKTTGACTGRN